MAGSSGESGGPGDQVLSDGLTPRDQLQLANALVITELKPGFSAVFRDISDSSAIRIDFRFQTLSLKHRELTIRETPADALSLTPGFTTADLLDHELKVGNGLPAALSQPVIRQRQAEDQLSDMRLDILHQALGKKYGEAAQFVEIAAIFADIPPETVKSIVVSADLQTATFIPSAADESQPLRDGFWLIVISRNTNETEKFLIRLD